MNVDKRERSASDSETDGKINRIKERLESKRQALLNSISEKKELQKSLGLREEQDKQVLGAVVELSRLGFSFNQIVAEAGVDSSFLKRAYEKGGRSAPNPPRLTLSSTGKAKEIYGGENYNRNPEAKANRNLQHQPTTRGGISIQNKGRPMIKKRRTREQPQWLNNLVIDLNSSEDERKDDATISQVRPPSTATLAENSPAIKTAGAPTKPAGVPININAEVGRITMRLKIEISRLKQRIKSSQGFSLDKQGTKALADKKAVILKDIEELFEEVCLIQTPRPS
ncbi:LAQU0S08e00628g1_1 [Lachancea quebecensis]|uniref:LAQU0S08e00628g1_1 n=1 Tax=Lachancea quebecensis TaxID=1654605 RepID=A0A0P1KV51_9SACH|nr:LAQU0S08e00628g1_1 [Lachancea quebecensis]